PVTDGTIGSPEFHTTDPGD
ncbi:unnamed protein product, partial [Allacma fusca]